MSCEKSLLVLDMIGRPEDELSGVVSGCVEEKGTLIGISMSQGVKNLLCIGN